MTIEGRSGMREIAWHMMVPCLCWWEGSSTPSRENTWVGVLFPDLKGAIVQKCDFRGGRWSYLALPWAMIALLRRPMSTIGVSLVSPEQWRRRMGGILQRALMILTKSNSQMCESRNWRCYWPSRRFCLSGGRIGVIYEDPISSDCYHTIWLVCNVRHPFGHMSPHERG